VIIGIGVDLCDIRRIARALDRYGERFTRRCFTETERAKADRRADRAGTYAKRFAAKEACSKALGTGIRGIRWQEMGVVNLASGQPTFALSGKAQARLDALTPPGHVARVHLTLTDEHPLAQAIVMIEALPKG
jgi:holo-[acyl-carrier protein] synthase